VLSPAIMAPRNTAFTDLLFSSGLRLREGGCLLTLEVPDAAGGHGYYEGTVAGAVAKRRQRMFHASAAALRRVAAYVASTRADAVCRYLTRTQPARHSSPEGTRRCCRRDSSPSTPPRRPAISASEPECADPGDGRYARLAERHSLRSLTKWHAQSRASRHQRAPLARPLRQTASPQRPVGWA
jgi:hypothetical protein